MATPSTITFEYWDDNLVPPPDPNHPLNSGNYTKNVRVTYSLSGTDLVRSVAYYHKPSSLFDNSTEEDQVIAEHVTALAFSYRKSDNKTYTDDNLTTAGDRPLGIGRHGRCGP